MHSASQDPHWITESIQALFALRSETDSPGISDSEVLDNGFFQDHQSVHVFEWSIGVGTAGPIAGQPTMTSPTFQTPAAQSDPSWENGPQVLQLLFAAYKAGLHAAGTHFESPAPLVRLLDKLGVATMVCKPGGTVVHETAQLRNALSKDLEQDRIRDCMWLCARSLGRPRTDQDGSEIEMVQGRSVDYLQTRIALYLVKAFFAGYRPVERDDLVIVSLEPFDDGRGFASTELIQTRFKLTRQQTRIAFLLTERRSDKEIADVLSISPHTVRRHIEEILDKLEIHSRRDVAGRLREASNSEIRNQKSELGWSPISD